MISVGEQSIYTRAILANYKNMYAWFFCGGGGGTENLWGGGGTCPPGPPVATPLSGIRIKSRKLETLKKKKRGKSTPSIANKHYSATLWNAVPREKKTYIFRSQNTSAYIQSMQFPVITYMAWRSVYDSIMIKYYSLRKIYEHASELRQFSHSKTDFSFNILLVLMILCLRNIFSGLKLHLHNILYNKCSFLL